MQFLCKGLKKDRKTCKLIRIDLEKIIFFYLSCTWQFKGWPWNADGAVEDIFNKTCGFHVRFANQPMDQNILKWQVKVIELPANSRHQDAAMIRDFWKILESWIAKNKPQLRF